MKRILLILFLAGFSVSSLQPEPAKLKVVTSYSYIASITKEIAGIYAHVEPLAKGTWDPHFVVPRPSYIAKLRDADLFINNGAELETGWVPPLIKQANNDKLNGNGILELAMYIKLQEIPKKLSRAQGDVHPEGNPHFILDPNNVLLAAQAIQKRLSEIDPSHDQDYKKNLENFSKRWRDKLVAWSQSMAKLKGQPVVQYHGLFNYLLNSYGIKLEGTVERLPGIPPTAKHLEYLEKLITEKGITIIIQDVYNPDDATKALVKKLHIKMIVLPHDVGAVDGANDIFSLFDEIVRRLTHD